jgi:hypothetical protein
MERWLYGAGTDRRRLQDSPILPDVWFAYALGEEALGPDDPYGPLVAEAPPAQPPDTPPQIPAAPEHTVDLLLRPASDSSASELAALLDDALTREREDTELAFNDNYVVARLTFPELIQDALPLSEFWQKTLWPGGKGTLLQLLGDRAGEVADALLPGSPRHQGRRSSNPEEIPGNVIWLLGVVGRMLTFDSSRDGLPGTDDIVGAALRFLGDIPLGPRDDGAPLWSVSRNRPVRTTVNRSRVTCKADAATTLFGLSCRDIRWAVIDSGVDARHPAFATRKDPDAPVIGVSGQTAADSAQSRVAGTWDFSGLRAALVAEPLDRSADAEDAGTQATRTALQVARGRSVNWERIAPQLQIKHDEHYTPPANDHGTHVAGILVGDWRPEDKPRPGDSPIRGMCPDMRIYDLRAFNRDGESDEFSILSAMQFVRHLNAHADVPVVHGVNLSFSVAHDVDKYAAGGTPVCEEAHRLIGNGVVVVAAAGNDGRGGYVVNGVTEDGFRTVSITDPGNAEKVITVGATHREQPHTYGVSYFSSRGPTGDGRAKPDLVAPGEKITSVVPDAGVATKDGTSQATPHVSGACAMLLARHPELIGQPEVVKQVLLEACTDLGRERYFQGAGLLDVLRALQAV